jgi:hypothetical protein
MTPLIQRLLAGEPATAKKEIESLSSAQLLAPEIIVSEDDASLVKAAVYLKHGFLEEAHIIAQGVATPTGSYWHGIMHRHEGDISNSKYWYARVGQHPVLLAIGGYPKNAEVEQREFQLLLEYTIKAATGR